MAENVKTPAEQSEEEKDIFAKRQSIALTKENA